MHTQRGTCNPWDQKSLKLGYFRFLFQFWTMLHLNISPYHSFSEYHGSYKEAYRWISERGAYSLLSSWGKWEEMYTGKVTGPFSSSQTIDPAGEGSIGINTHWVLRFVFRVPSWVSSWRLSSFLLLASHYPETLGPHCKYQLLFFMN